ncbi:hypothetical protein HELRODRAFT_179718 [Helobdella robusta]|uniref:Uncharacterized protein n=1 Tax=Helobdella robusta TaxID=6412 RepID=T1FF26_HELRO|nr:hypothetical protein HELRODRAFT_179718 [Helobdella robusta]ESN95125.1 hypothetical protein HELRODRAFT_179718 [Helobdella robusta]
MAQRFVPSYLHSSPSSSSGWYVPQFHGGNNFGCKFLDPVQLPAIHLPTTILQPATTQLLETANQQSIQQQAVPKVALEHGQADNVNQAQVQKVGSGEGVASVAATHVDKVAAPKAQPIKKYKYSGMVLATLASATISLGVSNTVVTALTVMTSSGSVGCFGTGNSKYDTLGPRNDVMKALDWSWVTVGLWASILIFVTGNLAGGLTQTSSQRAKALTTLGLLSLVLLIPLTFILAVLDAVLSADCMATNVTKFVTPIIIVFISALEFGVLAYIVISLRRQTMTTKQPLSLYSSAQSEQQIQRQQPAISTNNGYYPSQLDSSSSSAPVSAKRRKSAKTPNITVINLPANSSGPQAPNFIPIPYPQQSQPQNRFLQPMFYPANKPNIQRRYQPNSAFQPRRTQYQLPSRWYPGGGAGGAGMNSRVVPGAVPFFNSRRPASTNNNMMGVDRPLQYGAVRVGGVAPWIRPADCGMYGNEW